MDLPRYDPSRTYEWNYGRAIAPPDVEIGPVPGPWSFLGLPVDSPLGIAAGPLLNGAWCLYYAALGFDVVTYKTVRGRARPCYDLPNLVPVTCGMLRGDEPWVAVSAEMRGTWAVSFGMPSRSPEEWRRDVEWTRSRLRPGQRLSVSVVGTLAQDWTLDDLASDYAMCARWAKESGADCVEANFSCPNVATRDGQLYQHPADAAVVAASIREAIGRTPLVLKIGYLPDADIAEAFLDAVEPFVNGLAMTNSIATAVRAEDGSYLYGGQRRGICGAATFDVSMEQTRRMRAVIDRRRSSVQLIGVGGADSLDRVLAYLDGGASAVHLATAPMVRPDMGIRIRSAWRRSPPNGPPS
ncbi:MAG: hypothetical protein FJ297_11765 [Planctomycetes bacterium]|nr:hypothetical protein [Planctomycetota bacterium]